MPDGEALYQIARRVLTAFGKGIVNTWAPVLRTKEMEPFDQFTASHTMAARFIPIITSYIDEAGRNAIVELDQAEADQWLVKAPHVIDEARTATLDLCQETINNFRDGLTDHIDQIRKELGDSIYAGETSADAVDRLAKWVNDEARWRARRIAVTESARAFNVGQMEATKQYDFVAGYELVLSADACPLCHSIHRQCPKIRKGESFGQNGKNDTYRNLKAPPFHPGCRCTVVVIFDDEVPKEWPKLVKPGDNGYIQPSEADYANAIEGGYESVAIGNAKSLTGFITLNDEENDNGQIPERH